MIVATSNQTENFSAFLRERQFELDPPCTNTFIPCAMVSFIQQTGRVDIRWTEAFLRAEGTPSSGKILDEILARAHRDLNRFPMSARARTNLGLALINCGQLEEAAEEFEAALRLDPKHYVAAVNLARVRVSQGKFDQAKELYSQIQDSNPSDIAPLMGLAYIAMRGGDFSSAIGQLKQVLRLDDKSALARYQLAVAFMALSKPTEAITHLRVAASLEVRSPAVHQALAVAYTMSGDLRRAVRSFRAALTLDPVMREAIHGLSSVLLRLEQPENATQLLTSYLEKQPGDTRARENLALAYKEQKRYSASRAQLLEVLANVRSRKGDTSHKQTRLMTNIATSYAREGNLEDSERWINKAIELSPGYHPFPYLNLARIYLKGNHLQKAERTLIECRQRFPEHEETSYLLAACLERGGRHEAAIEELRLLIGRGKADADAYSFLGSILIEPVRDSKGALAALKRGYELFPRDTGIINNLAYVHLIRGEVASARTILASAPSNAPPNVYLSCTNGLLLLWEGNILGGQARYLEAERMARQDDKWDLARTVSQKMHLEVARAYARGEDLETALNEVERGLKVRGGKDYYREDLLSLSMELRGKLDASDGQGRTN
jgi:Flp pilus assembly protein TadD